MALTLVEPYTPPLVARITPHPAKFSAPVLAKITDMLEDWGTPELVLDPFAGTGLVHTLPVNAIGIELEPEWAACHPRTIQGNALHLPFADGTFTGMITSPTFANRMSDHHEAKDGSIRHTYRHQLGRALHPDNSGQLPWGRKYKTFHHAAWTEALRVLAEGALIIVNMKNHIRKGEEQPVVEWHFNWFMDNGCTVVDFDGVRDDSLDWGGTDVVAAWVESAGQGHGANSHLRCPYEAVMAFRKDPS